ncbi:MAG: Crp/Fnr family transcriptional regulator [Bacteroidales bacterium]
MTYKELALCPLCSGMSEENRQKFLDTLVYKTVDFEKGENIARQGDTVNALFLLIKGSVKTEMINESGQLMAIETMKAPRPLAPAFLFAEKNQFPVDVIALEKCEILMIPKEEVMKQLANNEHFMRSYLKFNSNRTQFLTDKLQLLSIKTIKGKMAFYILSKTPGSESGFEMDRNQTQLADYFAVARPSLARTIAEMEEEGLIQYEKKKIRILNRSALQKLL